MLVTQGLQEKERLILDCDKSQLETDKKVLLVQKSEQEKERIGLHNDKSQLAREKEEL